MKRNAIRTRKTTRLPNPWHEAEYAALRADAADTYDDRASANMFDVEDERAEVDVIVRGMMRDEH